MPYGPRTPLHWKRKNTDMEYGFPVLSQLKIDDVTHTTDSSRARVKAVRKFFSAFFKVN